VRAILDDPAAVDDVETSATVLSAALSEHVGRRLKGTPPAEVTDVLDLVRARLDRLAGSLRKIPDSATEDVKNRKDRAVQLTGHLQADVALARSIPDGSVAWVEGPDSNPRLRVAPLDVAELLRDRLWDDGTVVLTSATLPPGVSERLGLQGDDHKAIDVGSPFDYEHHGLLYCAAHLPDPRDGGYEAALHEELLALITAAGGRTLGLFTSYRAMDAAVEALKGRLPGPLLSQRDLPKPALVEAFAADPATSLFATMGFWQGIDVPGPTLSLVTIDKLPFPRPDEPLLQARREQAKAEAFRTIDLPRTATMLAQGAGRLIRTRDDRGVVAVLDPRLAKAKSYRWILLDALPPFPRSKDRSQVEAFLRQLAAEG
jgi:ATP-dependent DNA helicase DinG